MAKLILQRFFTHSIMQTTLPSYVSGIIKTGRQLQSTAACRYKPILSTDEASLMNQYPLPV